MDKHVCKTCVNSDDALDFSIKRRGQDTGKNTVFIGKSSYSVMNYDKSLCGNDVRMHAYKCDLKAQKPFCRYLGRCFGEHKRYDSHLLYELLHCVF
jgi:hypothetical protein